MKEMVARGEFDVSLAPLVTFAEGKNGVQLGRMSITQTSSGDLAGQSRGEMLSAGTGFPGSAGYVAIEQVEGALHGRSGSFVLQHYGIMERGEGRLGTVDQRRRLADRAGMARGLPVSGPGNRGANH